jgi:hypothetical protein
MTTKDLIEWLNKIVLGNDIPREEQLREEIIKRLEWARLQGYDFRKSG